VAKRDIPYRNPGMARVFEAVFLAFSNDAWTRIRRVISHLLLICQVAVVTVFGSHVVALSRRDAKLHLDTACVSRSLGLSPAWG
jgi:hypothetical protein